MKDPTSIEGKISFLSVGTRILLKDVMDHHIRNLGDHRTHYAPNMKAAMRIFSENTIHVLITEMDLEDGTAYRLLQMLGGAAGHDDDLYVIVALEERNNAFMALAEEMEASAMLIKPINAADIKDQIDKYKSWKAMPKDPWQLLVQEGQFAAREKRYNDAEESFKQALQAAPNNAQAIYKSALYFLAKPDYTVAEMLLKKALQIKPNYVQAISSLGSLYLLRKDLDKGLEYLSKAQAISPYNPDRLVEMVKVHLEKGIEACRNSLRIEPSSTLARFQLGKLLALQKDYAQAIKELERILPKLRDDPRNEAQTYIALSKKLGGLKT